MMALANSKGFELNYKKSGNYSQEIMTFINFMIEETNLLYSDYEKDCLALFEQIFLPTEKRISPNISLKSI
jgi:hypothetical protein